MHPHSRRAALAAACFLATTSSGRAQLPAEPQWWSAPGTGIWAAGPVNVENARPLNVGQLKHVASQARTYLDNVLQPWGGAGTAITTLTTQFQGNSTNPLTPVAERAENAAPVNVGQLKQVAELFYDRLAEMGLDAGTETAARLGGTASLRPGKSYMVPWQNNLPATENNSIATIGQLKMAFGFEVDVDQDGVLDALEWYLINASSVDEAVSLADIDASAVMADADGDGLTAAQEFTAHTSWISPDTDNDGMLDGWELGNQLNPLADDAGEDSDLDQLTNVEEYQISWQTGQAFNPRSSHSFGPEWTDYEQSLLQTWGQSPAAVSAQRGSDQNALRSAPLYGQYRRGISYWIAQHLIGSGPQAPGSGWQPFVGTALRWLGKADEGDLQEDIQIAPSSGFADREVALPGWPEGLPESAFLYFGNGFSGMATASGGTTDVRDYAGQEIPENLIYSYENLGGKLDQLRVWLRLPQKVDFPVTRSFYVLKRTRYAATTPDMVELPSAVLDGLTLHTLTVPPAFQNGVPPLAEPTLPTGEPPVLLAAGSAGGGGGTNPLPASSESLPVDVAPTSDAVSKARVRHLSTAQPFRFVFRAYPQGLLQESGGAPVSAETEPIAYLPVRVNENREQTDGPAALGLEPTFESMPDIDHNRASVASTGFLSGEALSYDRDFIKLEFDAGNIPEDEISVEVHTSVASGTKLFLYDDEGRAISQEELQATALQPIAPIWGKLISGKVYAEIGRLNTAASSPVPGSPALPPAGAATITVEARFHNPQAPLHAGQPAAPTILSKAITLLPVEVAPEILAVNSDFDEGRVNEVSGYAIPDCDDPGRFLGPERAHLDGRWAMGTKVTEDMHEGWFGVKPNQLGADFWTGSTVTLKKIDKTDPDTNKPQSGEVRFYATDGVNNPSGYQCIEPYDLTTHAAVNLVTGGIYGAPGRSVYGGSTDISSSAKFWIEGIKPGKITLEWRYVKGSTDIKYEQTFLVATHKSKAGWIGELRYQIRLQTSVAVNSNGPLDLSQYDPSKGFFEFGGQANVFNHMYVREIYYYYRQLFRQSPEQFYWAGMAKVAGASVYAGMSEIQLWKDAQQDITLMTILYNTYYQSGYIQNLGSEKFLDQFLVTGNKEIFGDMGWAHLAYQSSGISALEFVENSVSTQTEKDMLANFDAWRLIDSGVTNSNLSSLRLGNRDLLRREQSIVMQQYYDFVRELYLRPPPSEWLTTVVGAVYLTPNDAGLVNAGEWLSANAVKNPIPGGPAFRAGFPARRLDYLDQRWDWIENSSSGMLERWLGTSTGGPNLSAGNRASLNQMRMYDAAMPFTNTGLGLPEEL